MRSSRRVSHRTGTVLALTLFMLVTMMAFMAFAVDVGYLNVIRTELQRSADSAAMASAWDLLREGGVQGNPTQAITDARATAGVYAGKNNVGTVAPTLAQGDVHIGLLDNLASSTAAMTFADTSRFNAVCVRIQRTEAQNHEVPLFFARALKLDSVPVQGYSTAAFCNNFAGFRTPSDGSNVGILPFALLKSTWDTLVSQGTDDYRWDETHKTIAAGGDGVKEVTLFPQATGASGNCGTVDIGSSSNSTNDIKRQIVQGISKEDFQALTNAGRSLVIGSNGQTFLEGDTGISAGVASELESIKGQPRVIPIYQSVSGPGNNAVYTIVQYAGVRIMYVDLTGGKNKNKKVVIQPANITVRGGVPASGTVRSQYVYSPVHLIHWQPPAAWMQ
jgi:hypothetical protein